MFVLLFFVFGDAIFKACIYISHAPSKFSVFSAAFAHRKYALRNRNRNSLRIVDLSVPFRSSCSNAPSNMLFAMSASLKDSSNFSNECAQIDRFSKTLDASIGSIGYDVALFVPCFVLSSASSRLVVLNNTRSKRAFAFVYDSNASEWLDACDTRANEENRGARPSSIPKARARKAGSLEQHPPKRARERKRERKRDELISQNRRR